MGQFRFVSIVLGEVFVTQTGTAKMLTWSADNLDSLQVVKLTFFILSIILVFHHLCSVIDDPLGPIGCLNSFYGRASGPMWLDNVRCTGRESNILNCSHNGIGSVSSFCDSGDQSGVECSGMKLHGAE